jgi:hypothetical protein
MRDFEPIPDPSGALQPPNRLPPTAVGTETPEPEPFRRSSAVRSRPTSLLGSVLEAVLAVPVLVIGAVLYPFTNRRRRRHRR